MILLSIVDVKKKELSMMSMCGAGILFVYPVIKSGELVYSDVIIGGCITGFSIVSNQKIGLADALLLFFWGLRYGSGMMIGIFWISAIPVMIYGMLCRVLLKKREYEIPFFPFLTVAYGFFIWMGEGL